MSKASVVCPHCKTENHPAYTHTKHMLGSVHECTNCGKSFRFGREGGPMMVPDTGGTSGSGDTGGSSGGSAGGGA